MHHYSMPRDTCIRSEKATHFPCSLSQTILGGVLIVFSPNMYLLAQSIVMIRTYNYYNFIEKASYVHMVKCGFSTRRNQEGRGGGGGGIVIWTTQVSFSILNVHGTQHHYTSCDFLHLSISPDAVCTGPYVI